jgi:hypothetical protein
MERDMARLKVICPHCGANLHGATDEMIGDVGVCRKCGQEFTIERLSPPGTTQPKTTYALFYVGAAFALCINCQVMLAGYPEAPGPVVMATLLAAVFVFLVVWMINLTRATVCWILLTILPLEVFHTALFSFLYLFRCTLFVSMVFGLVIHGIFLITRYLTRTVSRSSSRDARQGTEAKQP